MVLVKKKEKNVNIGAIEQQLNRNNSYNSGFSITRLHINKQP